LITTAKESKEDQAKLKGSRRVQFNFDHYCKRGRKEDQEKIKDEGRSSKNIISTRILSLQRSFLGMFINPRLSKLTHETFGLWFKNSQGSLPINPKRRRYI